MNAIQDALIKGEAWLKKHHDHVMKTMGGCLRGIQPTGEDLLRPELWKDIHWRWFFDLRPARAGKLTLENSGFGHTKRIVRDGEVIATTQKLSNGKWGLYNPADMKITRVTFHTAAAALKWMRERAPQS